MLAEHFITFFATSSMDSIIQDHEFTTGHSNFVEIAFRRKVVKIFMMHAALLYMP